MKHVLASEKTNSMTKVEPGLATFAEAIVLVGMRLEILITRASGGSCDSFIIGKFLSV